MDASLSGRVAIVTGAGRGLGRGMALGLARLGATVIGPADIASDFDGLKPTDAVPGRILPLHADLRRSADCDAVVKAAQDAGGVHILVNNAGLTLTYICPDLYRRPAPPKFWEASDEIVQNVMDANFVAADKLARRVAPIMVKQGWGRIVNVTTMLQTMSRVGFSPYGPSKAALEMASWVWAKELEGSGVTVNIVNPGAGANTPGMAEEIRARTEKAASTDWSSPRRWFRPCCGSSRATPTKSTACAMTPSSGTPTCPRRRPHAVADAQQASRCASRRISAGRPIVPLAVAPGAPMRASFPPSEAQSGNPVRQRNITAQTLADPQVADWHCPSLTSHSRCAASRSRPAGLGIAGRSSTK